MVEQMKMQSDNFDFPQELCVKSQALIGISGLDTRNNAIHKSIWDTFTSNRRIDCAPVVYKHIDNAYEFPLVKPKRNSYEWYLPKGILKKNWMDKYLNRIPAVIVVFYDLDWDDPQWNEKMIECASRVQSMRVALEGRNTKLAVVLIQNKPPIPCGDDIIGTEKAAALCSSCELHSKNLFILPHGDHLQGYAVRLENAFYDLAQNFYHTEARNIKSHREHLNKSTHQYLFVRHQFKMGFLNELKQDFHTAHKHYTHAYNNILEIRIVDTNAMEIRTVACFINYKVCRLMFALNLPRDAISQFKLHTERFKTRLGFQELSFEHHAWMSKQYSIFGDIFDEAVKAGLPAVQTQHPGLYYQQAVQHAVLRKRACEELCSAVTVYPTPDPLAGAVSMEFYGQRPWRPGKVSADPPDPQLEWNGIKALQYLENQVNHSNIIIALYGHAVAQFKTYRCLRTRRHLVVQMAEEYYNSEDYGKALTLLTHMLWDYRTECWWSLLSHILEKAIRCAYLTARIDDYIQLSLELLGTEITIEPDRKRQIYENFNRILRQQCPEPEPNIPLINNALALWKKALDNTQMLTLDMTNINSCIDCKAYFLQDKYQANEKAEVEIVIKNACDFSINFMQISISVNNPVKGIEYLVDESGHNNPSLLFNSKDVKKFKIYFTPDPSHINKELQILSVNVKLGNTWNNAINLNFSGLGNSKSAIPHQLMHFKSCQKDKLNFDNIQPLLTTLIVPKNSKLNMVFKHAKPALLGEWYQIEINLFNEKDCVISCLEFEINLLDDDESTEFSMKLDKSIEKLPITFQVTDLPANKGISKFLYMQATKVGERNINVKVTFNLLNDNQIPSLMEEIIHVAVVKPFDFTARFLSTMFDDVTKLYSGEDFVVMPVINCESPWPIIIENTVLEYDLNLENKEKSLECQIAGSELKNGESSAEMYLCCFNQISEFPITIGKYTVTWKRIGGDTTITEITIFGMPVDWIPLDLKVTVPAHGIVRTPMLVEYLLINKSQDLIHIDISIESSEAFMFAGYKQFQTTILPEKEKVLQYNLYPLLAGSVALPKLVLTIPESYTDEPALNQDEMNDLLQRTLPSHIFVMPQIKGNPIIPAVIKAANLVTA